MITEEDLAVRLGRLAGDWRELAGKRLARANQLGPGKAGEITATEAGVLRDCAGQLLAILTEPEA